MLLLISQRSILDGDINFTTGLTTMLTALTLVDLLGQLLLTPFRSLTNLNTAQRLLLTAQMTGISSLELMKSSSVLANYLPVVHSLFTLRHSTIQEQVDNHQVFITTLVQVNILLTTAGLVSLHGTLTLINIQMILSMVGTYLLTVFSVCSRL